MKSQIVVGLGWYNDPGIVDAIQPIIRLDAISGRRENVRSRAMMQRLGAGIAQAAVSAAFCQQRLNEQLQAGGVDSEFDREAIRKRVSAELFMIERIKRHVLDIRRLGLLFDATAWDRDGMCDNGVDITT